MDVFLYLFEAKNPGDRLWVSLNGVAGRSMLSIFQQSYKDWKGKFVRVCCNDLDPTLLDGFPLYWVNKGKKESKDNFRKDGGARQRPMQLLERSRLLQHNFGHLLHHHL